MLDICHLKTKLDTVIRDAHLPDKTASCLQFVTKRFIEILAKHSYNEVTDVVANRAYIMWSYLINEREFNNSIWWMVPLSNYARAVTITTPNDDANILGLDLCVDDKISAENLKKYLTDESFTDLSEKDDQYEINILDCWCESEITPELDAALEMMAIACFEDPDLVRIYQLDPNLPSCHNGMDHIKTRTDGSLYFTLMPATPLHDNVIIDSVELAVAIPDHDSETPQTKPFGTASFMDFVDFLSIRCDTDDDASSKWIPIKDLMIIEHNNGSFELYRFGDVLNATLKPVLQYETENYKTRSCVYNLIYRVKNFLEQADQFEHVLKKSYDIVRRNQTMKIDADPKKPVNYVSFHDEQNNLVKLSFDNSYINKRYLPASYDSIPVTRLLMDWHSPDKATPNVFTKANQINTWCHITVTNEYGNVLLDTEVSNITTQYRKTQDLQQLIVTVTLEDNVTEVTFQIRPNYVNTFHWIDSLMNESQALNEAAVMLIDRLSPLIEK